ncbi:MAG: hypothetical protein JW990_08680 [Thermoleophilia bacterium]|nr:hypothetical protein [Thermoleophilia bacterium]
MTLFMDIELVSIDEAESPDACTVTFDVIYAGETWCRSCVWVDDAVAAGFGRDERLVIGVARDALLELLATESVPVSFHLRLTPDGPTVLARATPGAPG